MKRKTQGLFIADDELRSAYGNRADEIIAALEENPDTQHKATMPAGKRDRRQVEIWLEVNGFVTANMGEFGKASE